MVGVEVKASATITEGDFAGVRRLARAAGRDFAAGVVLYDGGALLPFGDRMCAVPIQALWDGEPGGAPRRYAGSTSSPRAG